MRTLGELVQAALDGSAEASKIAAEQSPGQDDGFDTFLAEQLGQMEPSSVPETKVAADASQPSSSSEIMDDASFAMKLAEALNHGATMLVKLAEQSESPAVLDQNNHATTTAPVAQAGAKARANAAPHAAGPQGKVPTDAGKPTSEGGPSNHPAGKVAADRAASERLLSAKLAEHEMLRSIGQTKAAQEVLKEAQELQQKIADSVDQPNNPPVTSGEAKGSNIPDNQGLINMTKGQARDANTRQVSQFINESPKHDNAVAAHNITTHGLKLSSILNKRAEESCDDEDKEKAKKEKMASVLSSADSALKGLGNKVLGGLRSGGRALAKATDKGRVVSYGAKPSLTNKAMDVANKAGRSVSRVGQSDTAKRVAGAATLGAGALGTAGAVHAMKGDK